MISRFRLYSTEISATVNPDSASPQPGTLIVFDQDPFYGNYNPDGAGQDRGSIIRTLGGTIIQDFGVVASDGIITLSDTNALSTSTVTSLRSAYQTIDAQFYFTDGYECWKVQFSRNPKGLKTFRNIHAAYHNITLFSYEITFLVISKEI